MKKHHLLSLLLASFLLFLSFHGVHAQGSASISGDELCGGLNSPKCDLSHFKTIVQRLLVTIISIGSVLVVFFVALRFLQAEIAARQGNPAARMQAVKNTLNGFIGLIMILAVFGGFFLLALKVFGVQSWVTGVFRFISGAFVEHAYAADERLLPNPLGAYNLFDLVLAAVNLAVKFFIYPAVVVLWVWSGFQFVYSQGNPDGLKKAKSWLLWSFLITVIMFTLRGFTLALRNTMVKIAPQSAALIQSPAAGGQAATGNSSTPVTSCQGQNEGTVCTVAGRRGTCTRSDPSESGGIFDCYVTPGQ